jgi:hypothetical protein
MATQAYHRLIFRPDGQAYKVQVFDPTIAVTSAGDPWDYLSPHWGSVIDDLEREFGPQITSGGSKKLVKPISDETAAF